MSRLNNAYQGFHQQTWAQAIALLSQQGSDYVIATVIGAAGSTPRASGTKMVISQTDIYDTLGGGHLEFKVIEKARELIVKQQATQAIDTFQLGANLGQCCGGMVTVMFEVMINHQMCLDIYGAGHVAQALIPILAQLPIRIRWIDNRPEVFPNLIPNNVQKIIDETPEVQVQNAPPHSAYLVLTHNHQLDFLLAEKILRRDDVCWFGLIGSETKAKRFRHRLLHREFKPCHIEQMQCPVGLSNVAGKLPMEVAVSIAGQLIQLYQQKAEQTSVKPLKWQALKNMLSIDALKASHTLNQPNENKKENT